MYIKEGENRTREMGGTLFIGRESMYIHLEVSRRGAYEEDHFSDHVGKSFSRIRVYTDRLDRVPTASRPGRSEADEAYHIHIHTRCAVESSDMLIFGE